jgi:hypothetical protein
MIYLFTIGLKFKVTFLIIILEKYYSLGIHIELGKQNKEGNLREKK